MIKGHGPDPRLELRCGYWAAGMRRIRVSCQTLFPFNITDVTALRPSVRQTGRSPEPQDAEEVSGSTWMWQKDVCRNWIQSDWSIVSSTDGDLRGFSPLSLLFILLSVVLFTHWCVSGGFHVPWTGHLVLCASWAGWRLLWCVAVD